jgi:hypothetical protein
MKQSKGDVGMGGNIKRKIEGLQSYLQTFKIDVMGKNL